MTKPILNIISLPYRDDRRKSICNQMPMNSICFWDGIQNTGKPFTGISQAHKRIVRDAKEKGLEYVVIAEDDLLLTSPGSWDYFLSQKPEEFDLYLGTISGGSINQEALEAEQWSGLILYMVHSRFYDTFLMADEEKNIDRWLSGQGLEVIEKHLGRKPVYKICYPIVAICIDGVSDNSGSYTEHYKNFAIYNKLQ